MNTPSVGAPAEPSAESRFATQLSPEAKAELIRDIYGKHVAELLAIEDSLDEPHLLAGFSRSRRFSLHSVDSGKLAISLS